eukprot:75246-Chlamydomonas_euryale.AAC.4
MQAGAARIKQTWPPLRTSCIDEEKKEQDKMRWEAHENWQHSWSNGGVVDAGADFVLLLLPLGRLGRCQASSCFARGNGEARGQAGPSSLGPAGSIRAAHLLRGVFPPLSPHPRRTQGVPPTPAQQVTPLCATSHTTVCDKSDHYMEQITPLCAMLAYAYVTLPKHTFEQPGAQQGCTEHR